MSKSLIRWATAIALTASLVACGSSDPSGSEGEPAIEPLPSPVDMRTLALPLDVYKPTEETKVLITRAKISLVSVCMRGFGFDIKLATPELLTPFGRNEERYGITTEKHAGKYGYHPDPERIHKPSPEPSLSVAADSVLRGKGQNVYAGKKVPEGGCAGEASRTLTAGAAEPKNPMLADQLRGTTYTRSQEDSRVRQAFTQWSQCMQRSGYHYDRPMDANNDPAFATADPSPAEKATALADVRCKAENKVIETWMAVEIAYQKREIDKNAEELRILKTDLDNQIRNVNKIIGA